MNNDAYGYLFHSKNKIPYLWQNLRLINPTNWPIVVSIHMQHDSSMQNTLVKQQQNRMQTDNVR